LASASVGMSLTEKGMYEPCKLRTSPVEAPVLSADTAKALAGPYCKDEDFFDDSCVDSVLSLAPHNPKSSRIAELTDEIGGAYQRVLSAVAVVGAMARALDGSGDTAASSPLHRNNLRPVF
jgi:hypothetical protein